MGRGGKIKGIFIAGQKFTFLFLIHSVYKTHARLYECWSGVCIKMYKTRQGAIIMCIFIFVT